MFNTVGVGEGGWTHGRLGWLYPTEACSTNLVLVRTELRGQGWAGGNWIPYVPLLTCGALRGEGVGLGGEVGYVVSGFG